MTTQEKIQMILTLSSEVEKALWSEMKHANRTISLKELSRLQVQARQLKKVYDKWSKEP